MNKKSIRNVVWAATLALWTTSALADTIETRNTVFNKLTEDTCRSISTSLEQREIKRTDNTNINRGFNPPILVELIERSWSNLFWLLSTPDIINTLKTVFPNGLYFVSWWDVVESSWAIWWVDDFWNINIIDWTTLYLGDSIYWVVANYENDQIIRWLWNFWQTVYEITINNDGTISLNNLWRVPSIRWNNLFSSKPRNSRIKSVINTRWLAPLPDTVCGDVEISEQPSGTISAWFGWFLNVWAEIKSKDWLMVNWSNEKIEHRRLFLEIQAWNPIDSLQIWIKYSFANIISSSTNYKNYWFELTTWEIDLSKIFTIWNNSQIWLWLNIINEGVYDKSYSWNNWWDLNEDWLQKWAWTLSLSSSFSDINFFLYYSWIGKRVVENVDIIIVQTEQWLEIEHETNKGNIIWNEYWIWFWDEKDNIFLYNWWYPDEKWFWLNLKFWRIRIWGEEIDKENVIFPDIRKFSVEYNLPFKVWKNNAKITFSWNKTTLKIPYSNDIEDTSVWISSSMVF